jgi:cytochrome c biogenesis protein CcdA/thiol-disulfide isomerase/thioredoxin
MVELVVIGVVAGLIAGISPCILPVLPVLFVTGATSPDPATSPDSATSPALPARRSRRRPVAVVAGLVVSFSVFILAGSEILSALDLPQDFLRDAGVVLLVAVGLGFLITPLGELLERPFARIGSRQPSGSGGGFVVGLALGPLFVPCAGPILAAITVVGATHRVGPTAIAVTVAFAAGTAIPLLAIAVAGSELSARVAALRSQAPLLRQASGVVLIVMAVGIGLNAFSGLQTDVPGYTSALQTRLEGSGSVRKQLNALTGGARGSLSDCDPNATGLQDCGPAPEFTGITTWLNTPDNQPLSLAALRGKVVLVDFWTYSCINCERTLPHVEAWYKEYAPDGFVVVGVHTPEFAFEHVVSNVATEASTLGVHYPVAIDNAYDTWNAYSNEYWPADYLIDAQGDVRHVHFGEGDYSGTENLIRQLLVAAQPGVALPAPSGLPDQTPAGQLSPETYIGYQNLQYLLPAINVTQDAPATYQFPASLPLGGLGLDGSWTEHAEEATAGANAELELGFVAHDVYLVLGGTGTVDVTVDGHPTQTVSVAGVPRLYTLYQSASIHSGQLLLHATPGVEAYDFTFG